MNRTYDAATVTRLALGDLEQELANTRRVLERVPEDRAGWKPHPKSWSLLQLAAHLSNLIVWQLLTIRESEYDTAGPPPDRTVPASVAALLEQYDALVPQLTAAVRDLTVEDLLADWTLRHGEHVILTQSRGQVLRMFGISHMAHHRGQLTVYLRMLDVPLPGIYGPTADETG